MATCPHFANSEIQSCLALTSSVFKNARSFIAGEKASRKMQTLFSLIEGGCITREIEGNSITVNKAKCIGCGFCISGCPSHSFSVANSLVPSNQCGNGLSISSAGTQLFSKDNFSDDVFRKLSNTMSDPKSSGQQSVAKFTSSDEVRNLSPWAAQIAGYICGSNSEVALEVNIEIEGKRRAGRLDVCVRSESGVFIFESKKSFKSMITEGRIFDQFLDYRLEIEKICAVSSRHSESHLFILVGGDETDFFPEDHPECSSFDRDASKRTFNWLTVNNGKVITAHGLLWLAFRDLTKQEPRSVEVLKRFHSDSSALVLTSRGLLCVDNGHLLFKNLVDS